MGAPPRDAPSESGRQVAEVKHGAMAVQINVLIKPAVDLTPEIADQIAAAIEVAYPHEASLLIAESWHQVMEVVCATMEEIPEHRHRDLADCVVCATGGDPRDN